MTFEQIISRLISAGASPIVIGYLRFRREDFEMFLANYNAMPDVDDVLGGDS